MLTKLARVLVLVCSTRPGALEVDEVDERRAHRHEPLGDSLRSVRWGADAGRGTRPVDDPGAATLKVDRGDDLHADQAPAASSRRWKLIGIEPLRRSVSWNSRRLN